MTLTLGIDLASQNENTAACLIDWSDSRAAVLETLDKADDGTLVERMKRVRDAGGCVGIDAPFGWPEPFLDAMVEYRERGRFSALSKELAYRTTDRKEFLAGKQPLSVSSDRIAYVAWRCARLLTKFFGEAPVTRLGPTVVEVYPGASMASWGLKSADYKKSEPVRQRLLDELRHEGMRWESGESLTRTEHVFDAFIAALSARAFQVGLCATGYEDHRAAAEREGWIMVPAKGSLAALLGR